MIGQAARFGAVGAVNTLLTVGTFAVLAAVNVPAAVGAPFAFIVGALNGYAWNRRWTFAGRRSSPARYAVVTGYAAAGTDVLLAAGVPSLVALGVITILAFAANRSWVFPRLDSQECQTFFEGST